MFVTLHKTREKKEKVRGTNIKSILEEQSQRYLEANLLSEPEGVKGISVVACIPAFNEERLITHVILEAQKYVDLVVVCDDGSIDNTSEIAESIGALVIKNERNMGKGIAARNALQNALKLGADFIVMLDGDGQHNPNEIPQLIGPIIKGEADIVIGSRYVMGGQSDAPLYRKIGLGVIEKISKRYINRDVKDSQSGFRSFSYEALVKIINTTSKGFGLESEQLLMASQNGLRIMEMPVNIRYKGLGGTSTKNPLLHGIEIVGNIFRLVVEKHPRELLGVPGVISLFLGIAAFSLFLYYFNLSRYFSLPLAIISTLSIFFGILLIVTSLFLYVLNQLNRQP